MDLLNELPACFNITESPQEAGGVTWFNTSSLDLRQLATYMRQAGARFVTITAFELPRGEGFRLEYLWDSGGHLFGFPFFPAANSAPSIYDICEATDWIEREIHEEYAIEFEGREYEQLLLRTGQHPGVNLQEVAK